MKCACNTKTAQLRHGLKTERARDSAIAGDATALTHGLRRQQLCLDNKFATSGNRR